jgi:tRNA G10  N-methylase Trm11
MKHFFILGRNPELSRAELYLYLESRKNSFKEVFFEENLLIVDIKDKILLDVQKFGGILGLGGLREFITQKELIEFLEKNEFIELDKFNYSVMGNIDSFVFSEKFKREKKKAQIRNFGKKLRFQSGESFFRPHVDVEILAQRVGSKIYLGFVEQNFDSSLVEKRDMQKPFRRESLAISPRLARILINLSGAKEKDLILDPFCGVGGIVQEAILMGINSIGIDKDSEAIRGANQNIVWLRKNFNFSGSSKFFNINSLNAENKQYDAIVAESSLGEVLRKRLKGKKAESYLDEFEESIIPLLKKFKEIKKKDAKIAITFPCFNEIQISGEEISQKTGLRVYSSNLVEFPIIEKRIDQFVNRQIWVFY